MSESDPEFEEYASDETVSLDYEEGELSTETSKFSVLQPQDVTREMKTVTEDANEVLQLPSTIMMVLLNHFGWDKDKLMEEYYDKGQKRLFNKLKVVLPSSFRSTLSAETVKVCQICWEKFDSNKMFGMGCGHIFCPPCWVQYLRTKIMDEGIGQKLYCAGHKCPILIDDVTVMKLVTDPDVQRRYQQLVANTFVQCNKFLKWCPAPDCTNAIQVEYRDFGSVTCSCRFKFCFQCIQECHDPITCEMLKQWVKKCSDDSETSKWIVANTKECPKCRTPIEKNGGCNHMSCRNMSCNTEFCWHCLRLWSLHGTNAYECNAFDDKNSERDHCRSSLARYFFYSERYMNHKKSLELEGKLNQSVADKMEIMMERGMISIDCQFLKKAVDALHDCRQTLMYTYAFAFYLKKNNQSSIFEENQRDLEMATEDLSRYLERDIDAEFMENIVRIKTEVLDKSTYCDQRWSCLLTHVNEGYQNDFWIYNEELKK